MSAGASLNLSNDRWTALALRAGDLRCSFLPGLGMLCASFTHRGEELLRRQRDLRTAAVKGSTAGIPFLHPWANRLGASTYQAAGERVDLDTSSPLLHMDGNGLPIHGVPWARLAWQVQETSARSLMAFLEWDSPELLSVFPYAHRLTMAVSLDETTLAMRVTLRALAHNAVPVSFGFHPYFGCPGAPRESWHLELPAMHRMMLDARGVPTGASEPFTGFTGPLGTTDWDTGFALHSEAHAAHAEPAGQPAAAPPAYAIIGGGRRIALEMYEGFRYMQVFAPAGDDCVALEPMTAETNALVSGRGLVVVPPGQAFVAAFGVVVTTV